LFYEQSTGHAEFYETDGQGGITWFASLKGLSKSWTRIVPGRFSDSKYTGILVYDQTTGFATIYDTDGRGILKPLKSYSWGASWTQITTVRIPNSTYSAVVLYDPSAGRGEIHECTGAGILRLRQSSDGWRTTWTHVVGGYASGQSLLFYEAPTGHCEIYWLTYDPGSTDPASSDPNSLGPLAESDSVPPATDIISGSFGSPGSFLFYDRTKGEVSFVFLAYGNNISAPETYTGLPSTWDIITPGDFWVVDEEDHHFSDGGFSDLLFYDRAAGVGEFYLHEPPYSTPIGALAGYTSTGSVRPGATIDFFVSSQVGAYTITIYRQAVDEVYMVQLPGLPTAPTPLLIGRTAWQDGAGWPVAGSLQIPLDWPSGLYLARVETGDGSALDIPFIVRPAIDGSQSRILVAMNDTTYEAYNHWGGRSVYGFGALNTAFFTAPGSGDGVLPWAFRVSFRRPQVSFFPQYTAKWTYWEVPLIRWLARQNIQVEWCTLVDLHREPALLDRYALFVNVGHAEYVSNEMRDAVVRFVNSGGNAAFFGGNNCWWRVRIQDDGDTMVCYKEGEFDRSTDPGELTVNWPDQLAAQMTGVSWSGYAFDDARKDNGELLKYVVVDANHWAFANTNLPSDHTFGTYGDGTHTIVGSETDNKKKDTSPPGFMTLASVTYHKDKTEAATMGVFMRGGTVFTASTMDWTLGLSQDGNWGPVDQITRNVIDRLSPRRPRRRRPLPPSILSILLHR
jgi:hypothetical protein